MSIDIGPLEQLWGDVPALSVVGDDADGLPVVAGDHAGHRRAAFRVGLLRDLNFEISAGRCRLERFLDRGHVLLDPRPAGGGKHDDGDAAAGEILLVFQVLVGGDQHLEAGSLHLGDQLTVLECRPVELECRADLVG